jgi:hypothetical protein
MALKSYVNLDFAAAACGRSISYTIMSDIMNEAFMRSWRLSTTDRFGTIAMIFTVIVTKIFLENL